MKDRSHSSNLAPYNKEIAKLIKDSPEDWSRVQSLELNLPKRFIRNQEPIEYHYESLDTPVPDPSVVKSSRQPDSVFPASEESKLDSSVVSH